MSLDDLVLSLQSNDKMNSALQHNLRMCLVASAISFAFYVCAGCSRAEKPDLTPLEVEVAQVAHVLL